MTRHFSTPCPSGLGCKYDLEVTDDGDGISIAECKCGYVVDSHERRDIEAEAREYWKGQDEDMEEDAARARLEGIRDAVLDYDAGRLLE